MLDTRPNSLQPRWKSTDQEDRFGFWLTFISLPNKQKKTKYKSNVFRTEMHKRISVLKKN